MIDGDNQPYRPPDLFSLTVMQGDLPEGTMAEWRDGSSVFVVRKDATRAQQLWALHGLVDLIWTGESSTLRREQVVEAVRG